ncbi:anthranilate synthase component I [Methanoculleus taiwanensis]|uniref:anthranilate synthase component I n=1 Tax=Methanoculleus taiwanensis TaxID=1550565 RepID=UPI000FFEB259|nr:anthranilate synthase component I [Methanoculleus taiwanensis]
MGGARREPLVELNLTLAEFRALAERRDGPLLIPLFCRVPLPACPPSVLYQHLRDGRGCLLESLEGSEKVARYSLICTDPALFVSVGSDGSVDLAGDPRFAAIAASAEGNDPVDLIRSIMHRFEVAPADLPRFSGGMVGYFAYDIVSSIAPTVCPCARDDLGMPVVRFMLATDCLIIDHCEHEAFIVRTPLLAEESDPAAIYDGCRSAIAAAAGRLASLTGEVGIPATAPVPESPLPRMVSSLSREGYMEAVLRIKEHIFAGDIFQAVISRRIEAPAPADPFAVYRVLRSDNPSPYMYYLDFGDTAVVGSSPEMLVRVEGGRVTTVPIAGTRPRGATPGEDDALAAELLADEKERAEHIMLVDLARNDVGAVTAYGSVRLDEFMGVERFSHVQHIVSTVSGTLRPEYDCFDVLKACFPAGTVSGAPKVRAMQLIDAVEGTRRGPYAGAVGHIGFSGAMDMAITIRTAVVRGGTAYIQVGAGIVADSDPGSEWLETERKAGAMLRALGAEGGI